MKSILNISFVALSALTLLAITGSCSDSYMDKINENSDNTTDVPAKFLLPDVLTSTAVHTVGGDMDTYIASYNEYEVGIGNQLWQAQKRIATSSSSTFGDSWNEAYDALKNAHIIISKCTDSGDLNTKGMGEVMAAVNSAVLTDNFGDIPFSQAALPYLVDGLPPYTNPKLDTQASVYDSIMNYLDTAIKDFNAGSKDTPGSYDYMYGGNASKWLKLAYGLKARYTMRLYDTYSATEKTTKMQEVLADVAKSFTSASEQGAYNVYGSNNWNPYYDFFISRAYLGISPTYLAKLKERKDPRLNRIVVDMYDGDVQLDSTTYTTGGGLAPIDGGISDQTGLYNTSIYSYAASAPTFYMSYHELMFVAAEAYERLGDLDNAKATLKKAVVAAIANTEANVTNVENNVEELSNDWEPVTMTTSAITDSEAEAYFDDHVDSLFTVNPLKEIVLQKYLGMFGCNGEGVEEYADIRRHKAANEDYFDLGNPLNSTEYPWELPYGSSAVTANPNVSSAYGDGQYVYANYLWWANAKTGKASN